MPVKPLPKSLIRRLRKAEPRLLRVLGKMKNIDPRAKIRPYSHPEEVMDWGFRVREMNVSRNYPRKTHRKSRPKLELVLKRAQMWAAPKEIREIRENVKEHNLKYAPKRYTLLVPHAYPIGKYLIAMQKLYQPPADDVLRGKNPEGRAFLRELKEKYGVGKWKLRLALHELCQHCPWAAPNHIICVGYKNGKFIFVPLIDVV